MKERLPELLAPAGSMEAVRAAVQNGADAVYMGFGAFNARRGAKNFTREEMQAAIAYCRVRGVKTNITVNTLVSDRELPALLDNVRWLLSAGADALIVQDLGAARAIRARFPDVVLHASTQMTIHSLAGARQAQRLGFSRVVLSRELPLSEIRHITEQAGVETEVFVHGALCMCYSGQCELSAVIGRRSGNRGLCAQPCRLPYGEKNRYPMSLKDLCLLPALRALRDIGVSSLKIEGRMKRPEYVAIVTKIYADVLRGDRPPTREEMRTLEKVFSRDGFTRGYLDDTIGSAMFGTRSETPERELRPLYDAAARTYADGQEAGRVPVALTFSARADSPVTLTASDGVRTVTVAGDAPERAERKATTEADVQNSLSKTGGTVFARPDVSVTLADGLRVPARAVNDLRRRALEKLTRARKELPAIRENAQREKPTEETGGFRGYTVQVRTLAQVTDALAALPLETIYVPARELVKNEARTRELLARGCALVPGLQRVIWDREQDGVLRMAERCRDMGCTAALCGNIGQISLVRGLELQAFGDFGLNIMNTGALRAAQEMGVTRQTLSFELRLPQVRDIQKPIATELIVAGRLPLMLTENCMIMGEKNGCARNGRGPCRTGAYYLTDRRGAKFPVFREEHCRNSLYNSQPLALDAAEYRSTGAAYARLILTDEKPQMAAQLAGALVNGRRPDFGVPTTRGLYRRGVE